MAGVTSDRQARIRIHGGRVIDPAGGVDQATDLYIASGRVAALGSAPEGFAADEEIDATGCVVCPGLIDIATALREPGQEHKATIATETRAAAGGGITTLCCAPDTNPVIDTPAVVELIRLRAAHTGKARVVTLGALTRNLDGEHLSEMAALHKAGCVGVSNVLRPMANSLVLRRALEYASTFDLTVFLHPLDRALANEGCAHEGRVATRLGLPAIPEAAETATVAYLLALIEQVGVRAHFCRLTTGRAARMVARARFDGVPVTADVAIPYLYLSENDICDFDTDCHVLPPLRTVEDREHLRNALKNGSIQAICSDHQPHEPDAKTGPFPATEPGISGLDSLLPLSLRLVEEHVLDLPDLIRCLTWHPAQILGLPYGTLETGAVADVCIFDPDRTWLLENGNLHSHGHNTPFRGWEMKGRVTHTLLEGRPVHALQP
jgi:dihydroorotase